MTESWEEEYKKQQIERLGDINVAVKSLDEAMEWVEASCKLCGRCNLDKASCDISKSYKKIKKVREELDAFRYNLENNIRRGF